MPATPLFFKAQFQWGCPNSGHLLATDPKARNLFVTLCMLANCCQGTAPVEQTGEPLLPGQLVCSLEGLATATALSKKEVRRALLALEKGTLVGTLKGTLGTLVTIHNWSDICGIKSEQGTPKGTPEGTILEILEEEDSMHTSTFALGEPKPKPESKPKAEPPIEAPAMRLAEIWNAKKHPKMPAIKLGSFKPGQQRWRSASKRMDEFPDPAYWTEIVEILSRSPFCQGVGARDGWKANFDFLIKPETHIKTLEGVYGGLKPKKELKLYTLDDYEREMREVK